MNGYIGLAAQDHGSKTTEQVPLWIGFVIWGFSTAVVHGGRLVR
jgi:hypothetical protein